MFGTITLVEGILCLLPAHLFLCRNPRDFQKGVHASSLYVLEQWVLLLLLLLLLLITFHCELLGNALNASLSIPFFDDLRFDH